MKHKRYIVLKILLIFLTLIYTCGCNKRQHDSKDNQIVRVRHEKNYDSSSAYRSSKRNKKNREYGMNDITRHKNLTALNRKLDISPPDGSFENTSNPW